jgi:long-chain acyl-CoA synthetase
MEKQVYALRKITNICPKLKRKVFKSVIDGLGGKLRLIISGAAALDQEVWEGFNEMGIIIRQGYGLSECAPVVSGENVKYERKNSIGLPLPDIEVAVFDKNEQGIGELAVKGENVMLGYYKNDEANKEAFRDGYFMTGDIGYVDRDGFVFITGRKKSVIVLKNGKNIYPEEIEALINKIPLVKESMVYGAPKDDDVLLSVKVQIDKDYVAENLRDMAEEEIKKMIWDNIKEINRTMPTYKYVKNMITTYDDFEKTTTQKIKRYIEIQKILEAEKE